MIRLRDPETGCPWDLEQDFKSIVPHTIEEAYEVADAIEREDHHNLKSELGDLLLQVMFYCQMAREENLFSFHDVAEGILQKMIRRHPHVFGDVKRDSDAQRIAWENQKEQERAHNTDRSALADIAMALPALLRATKLQKRAARIGFDWPDAQSVLGKLQEETEELLAAKEEDNKDHVHEEYGDLLFTLVNLGRKLDIDAEQALRHANQKFERRFRTMEKELENKQKHSLEEMERAWQTAKDKVG